MRLPLVLTLIASLPALALEKGTVRFKPTGDQQEIPERYRLDAHRFEFEMDLKTELKTSGVRVHRLLFPSPVETPHRENNTVHAEYYRPRGDGPFPGVVILDITGGDQSLSRSFATHLAQKGIAGLFVQMAYYGPRRPPGSKLRLMSYDLPQTFAAIRQTVLDMRRAAAWLEARPEIDRERLGIMGTSLGSLIAALTAEMEPRFKRVAVLLGGGGLIDGFWDHPQAAPYVKVYEKFGGTREKAKEFFSPIDPLTRADNLKGRKVLIMAAKKDEVVPPRMASALWEATGKQKLVWFDCGHYTAILYVLPALAHITEHFGALVMALAASHSGGSIMSRLAILAGVFGVIFSIVGAAPAPGKKGTTKEPISLVALRTVVPEFEEVPADPAIKFTNMLNSITQKMSKDHGLDFHIDINMAAFEEVGLNEEKMLDLAPVADKPLPKMRNVTLERYLQRLLERVTEKGPVTTGATILVRRDGIEITTLKDLRKKIWGDHPGPFFPLVHATIEKSLLEDALKELAEQTEYNLVLDVRVGEKVKAPVTGRFFNTPLDTAVKLLSDMADLAMLVQDNTIYVTTRDNAMRLEAKQKRELPDDPEGKPRTRIGAGTRGFVPREEQSSGMN